MTAPPIRIKGFQRPMAATTPDGRTDTPLDEHTFVAAAGSLNAPKPMAAPWLGLDNRMRSPSHNLRMTAEERAKVEFVFENTRHRSKHELLLTVVMEAIDRQADEIWKRLQSGKPS